MDKYFSTMWQLKLKDQIPVHFIFPVQQNFENPVHKRIYKGHEKIDSCTFQYIAEPIKDKKTIFLIRWRT